jgi:histidine triad (HIT) family protein
MNCIFCKIINGEIPCYKVYEDEKVLAFLDISQASKGHTLIVPKTHFANMLECDEETVAYMYKIANKLGNQIVNSLGAQGMNILTNINEVAGQTVKHFHIHLLPRYNDEDGVKIDFISSNPSKEDLESVLKLIIK